MEEPGERGPDPRPVGLRGRTAVAASILAVLLLGGYFAASAGDAGSLPPGFLVSAAVLIPTYWFPAMRIGSPAEAVRAWAMLLPWLAAWTLVWDLATSGLIGDRSLLQEWWIVYPAGIGFFWLLLVFHGWVVGRVEADPPEDA